jgi:integrase
VLFTTCQAKLAAAGATLLEATNFYLTHHRPLLSAPDLIQIAQEFLEEQRRINSPKYVEDLQKPNLEGFIRFLGEMPVGDISRDHVQRWVTQNHLSADAQHNRLKTARGFLEFARRAKYISLNPVKGEDNQIRLPKPQRGEILSYGPQQIRRLLHATLFTKHRSIDRVNQEPLFIPYHSFLGYLAVAIFCGVRPEEIRRTSLSNLDLLGRTLVVDARSSKTNKQRVIELSPVATAWLRLWRRLCPEQESFVPETFPGRWKALRNAAKLVPLHDGLRHTFATMHYAMHQNTSLLKAQMGHEESEDTLFRHYRAVRTVSGEIITRKLAEEFWGLMPTAIRDHVGKK